MTPSLTRRDALKLLTVATGGTILSACLGETSNPIITLPSGRLTPRPTTPSVTASPGLQGLPENNNFSFGQYFVPTSYKPDTAIPLVLLFHGSGQRLGTLMTPMSELAEEMGFALMAIDSREYTWDIIRNQYFGIDVNFLNRALPGVFDRVRVDPNKIGMAGFSDGASYALSLGTVNGDLIRRIVAFSPGFVVSGYEKSGTPDIYITHGANDPVLSFANTKNVIVPQLQTANLSVELHEFAGGNEIPADLMRSAAAWLCR